PAPRRSRPGAASCSSSAACATRPESRPGELPPGTHFSTRARIRGSGRAMPTDVKICGLKTAEALAAALDGGASHVGFLFFPKSPRDSRPEEAGQLRRAALGRAGAVAVTVDADDALLDGIVAAMAPDMLQLHGKESPARVAAVKARYGVPVMKALSVSEAADV